MIINARKGTFTDSPHPASQMPISGADLGKRRIEFVMVFHDTSWPSSWPCELSMGTYKKLLDILNSGKGHNNFKYTAGALGMTTFEEIMVKDRVQPSVVMRTLCKSGWRVGPVMNPVLGKTVGRSYPFEKWEELIKEFIEKLQKDGFPDEE